MGSEIKEFYSGKSIFITGATGFVGKVLLLKLLVSCPEIASIFILLRSKNNLSSEKRLQSMLSSAPFTFFSNDETNVSKVTAIDGDITMHGFGLSDANRQLLYDNVSVVFHCAASVKFDAPLKDSLKNNVFGTKSVIDMCHNMTNLISFVHVSTAYSNCQFTEIDEKLYPISTDANGILHISDWVSPQSLNAIQRYLLEGRPNTYTYTKALAEQLVAKENAKFPIAICRPSIVMNAYSEPVPGWVDNLNGPSGISVLGALGILRCFNWNYYAVADFVPVDKVANALIAIGWGISQNQSQTKSPLFYNITSSNVNPITWGNLFNYGYDAAIEAPSIRLVRPVIRPPKHRCSHPIYYPLTKLISHWIFAMVRITRKMHYAFDVMGYFTQHQWVFRSDNLISLFKSLNDYDRHEFDFDMSKINWKTLAYNCHYGNRRYLLNESDDTIPAARKRAKLIIIGYWIFKITLFIIISYLVILLTPINSLVSIVGRYFCYLVALGCPNVPYCPS